MNKKIVLISVLALLALSLGACGDNASASAHKHTYEKCAAVAPTCDTAGNSEYYVCKDCDKLFDAAKKEIPVIPAVAALGHEYVLQKGTGATCAEKGVIDYYTCDVCEKKFNLAKQEIAEIEVDYDYNNHTSAAKLILQSKPTKRVYKAGEAFDPTGMVVVYQCDDCDGVILDNQFLTYTYQTENAEKFSNGDAKITIGYRELSFDMGISVAKDVMQIFGVEESYETACGVAPVILATSSSPDSIIEIAYYDGETQVQSSEFIAGKTYNVKVFIAETESAMGAEVLSTVTVSHGYTWQDDAEDWQKLIYACKCGNVGDCYAMNYQSAYVDEYDLRIDLSKFVYGAKNVSVKSVQQIVRLKNGEYVSALEGDKVDIAYENNGLQYSFAQSKYEKASGEWKPYILTLAVTYEIDGAECPVVVEAKLVDKIIKTASDLKLLAYTGDTGGMQSFLSFIRAL